MHLTVIAKSPRPGFVKTRLCPPCTPEQAADIARAALADTFAAIDAVVSGRALREPLRRVLLLDGPAEDWVPDGYDVVGQRGDDLGARLANGFADLGPGVIVSMDSPAAGRFLGAALDAVAAGVDALGLAADGGYWAIGLAAPNPAVFEGVPMSCAQTGIRQLQRLHALGRPVRMLPMAYDLDTVADLRAVALRVGDGALPIAARRVVAAEIVVSTTLSTTLSTTG